MVYLAMKMCIRALIHVVARPLMKALRLDSFALVLSELFTVEMVASAHL